MTMIDVIVVGGSYAGMSAALQLARARRSVLVVDAGQRRNRFAASAHGFLGHDGKAPGLIAAQGRSELLAYPTVRWVDALATEARVVDGGFAVRAGDEEHRSRRIVLATGVCDELPALPGLAVRWGKSVFHCPYCHGYELSMGRLGVLATGPLSMHSAMMVSEWAAAGQTTLFLQGAFEPDEQQLAALARRSIHLERDMVLAVDGDAPGIDLHLRDGRTQHLDGLFVVSRTVVRNPFAEQLGCELEEGPTGSYFKTDATKETTVPGVFACGDMALAMGSISFAVADGVMAGTAAHRSLVFRT